MSTTELVHRVVLMGVSGSGKSTVGNELAGRLDWTFVDGDDLHSSANVSKMIAGHALTDQDRLPWLDVVATTIGESDNSIVVACSALKRSYRDHIRTIAPEALFVHLNGSRELLQTRMARRVGHFMPPTLLDTQLSTLETLSRDESGFVIDIDDDPVLLVSHIIRQLREGPNQ